MYIYSDKTVLTAQIRTDYLTVRWLIVKDPGFPPLLPQHSTLRQTILPSIKVEESSTFAQALRPPVKGNKKMNYCLQPKPWSMHRWGRMPAVYMSHHPTRFKRERKPSTGLQTHAFEQNKSSSRFDFHSTVCLHCAAGKTTCNKSKAWRVIQMGMHRETGGIQ